MLESVGMGLSSSCSLNTTRRTSHKYAGHSFLGCQTGLASLTSRVVMKAKKERDVCDSNLKTMGHREQKASHYKIGGEKYKGKTSTRFSKLRKKE